MHISYRWWHGHEEVFIEEFQQEIQSQPIKIFAVKNALRAALWFISLVNLAFFYILLRKHCMYNKNSPNLNTQQLIEGKAID